jgi:hypothetical protein
VNRKWARRERERNRETDRQTGRQVMLGPHSFMGRVGRENGQRVLNPG